MSTKREALEAIELVAESLREEIYRFLDDMRPWGATDEELQDRCGMSGNTQRPRRRELVQAGRVVDSGRRARTESGRRAIVWVAV